MKISLQTDFLWLNNKKYTFQEILNSHIKDLSENDFEKQTLQFCREWLSETTVFRGQTSGSTGKPKPILFERVHMQASAQATIQTLGLSTTDVALVCIPTKYIGGQMMLVRGLELGMQLYVIKPASNPYEILKPYLSDMPLFDFTALVPLQLQTILDESPEAIQSFFDPMKAIIVGGGAVSDALREQAQLIQAPVYNTYGMTETVSHIALKKLNGADSSDYFFTLDGVEIAQNEQECLKIKAPQTGEQWIQTNDRVKIIDHKRFEWLGRLDFVINTGGVKVQGELVEKVVGKILQQMEISRNFFIGGIPHPKLGQELCLIVEGNDLTESQESHMKSVLLEKLQKYEVPRRILYLDQLILTETSKINRKANLERLL